MLITFDIIININASKLNYANNKAMIIHIVWINSLLCADCWSQLGYCSIKKDIWIGIHSSGFSSATGKMAQMGIYQSEGQWFDSYLIVLGQEKWFP